VAHFCALLYFCVVAASALLLPKQYDRLKALAEGKDPNERESAESVAFQPSVCCQRLDVLFCGLLLWAGCRRIRAHEDRAEEKEGLIQNTPSKNLALAKSKLAANSRLMAAGKNHAVAANNSPKTPSNKLTDDEQQQSAHDLGGHNDIDNDDNDVDQHEEKKGGCCACSLMARRSICAMTLLILAFVCATLLSTLLTPAAELADEDAAIGNLVADLGNDTDLKETPVTSGVDKIVGITDNDACPNCCEDCTGTTEGKCMNHTSGECINPTTGPSCPSGYFECFSSDQSRGSLAVTICDEDCQYGVQRALNSTEPYRYALDIAYDSCRPLPGFEAMESFCLSKTQTGCDSVAALCGWGLAVITPTLAGASITTNSGVLASLLALEEAQPSFVVRILDQCGNLDSDDIETQETDSI
jgi:hypothetical protein